MSRDLWLTKRPAVHIDRIKKSLTLDDGSYDCGPTNSSLELASSDAPIQATGTRPLTLSATKITLDFWYYATPHTSSLWTIFEVRQASNYGLVMEASSSTFSFHVITSSATYSLNLPARWYQWVRYTIAVDTALNIGKVYFNGELQGTITVAAGSFSTTTFDFYFGGSKVLSFANGFLQDIAFYNVYKDELAVPALGTHKGTVGTYSGGLTYYWKLRGALTPTVGVVNLDGTGQNSAVSAVPIYSTEDYAPIKYGASFVAAQYTITLTERVSFRFPAYPPTGCNGMLVVRWVDDDEVTQRRRFWDMAGVDINPMPAVYNGEAVGTTFVLEWWNIDGEDTIEVPTELVLRISKTTNPTTGYDVTAVSGATLTVDTTLAANFPLTPFPVVFNTQQAY